MNPIYTVIIKVEREEEQLQCREYLGFTETGNENDPYGPQRLEVQGVERTIAKIEVGPYLEVNNLIRAVLDCSIPPAIVIDTSELK